MIVFRVKILVFSTVIYLLIFPESRNYCLLFKIIHLQIESVHLSIPNGRIIRKKKDGAPQRRPSE